MAKKEDNKPPARRNRTLPISEALGGVLDPALKKRGFAQRDIITQWAVIAPEPFNSVSVPDKLSWPRGAAKADGATLYLRCRPGHAFTVTHDGDRLAAAVNRYFGFSLVRQVRLSAEPLVAAAPKPEPVKPSPAVVEKVGQAIAGVTDDGLREALAQLGLALSSKRR